MKIGLIGAPGSGKDDVVAHVLCNKYGFIKFAFADQIKKCYYNEIGITDEYFKSCRGTPEEEKIRKGLWEFSDKMREEHGHDFFIDPVIKNVVKTNNAVITDIRTKDELIASVGLKPKPKIIIITRNYNPTEVEFYHNMFPETRIPNRWIYSFLQKGFEEIFFKFDNNFNTLEEAREGFALFYKKIGGI